MTNTPDAPFGKHLGCIQDPRRHNTRHRLYDILLIALCAIISGADSWTQVAEFGHSKITWFKEFLQLPNGIPSHDTFGRLFARIDPKGFQSFFAQWVQDMAQSLSGKTVAIDGKTLRRSHDQINGKSPIHMVSAWASEIRLVLGQIKTDDKSNEITAIPELIKTLALEGAIVTIDAMGCQKKITQTIIEEKADYVIQVKDNQQRLHEDIALFFQDTENGAFTCGPALKPSPWLSGSGRLTPRSRRKHLTSSPVSKTIPLLSPKPSENTGASKTACIGAWTSLSEKTTAGYAKTMRPKI
jgi:hypothetical protein